MRPFATDAVVQLQQLWHLTGFTGRLQQDCDGDCVLLGLCRTLAEDCACVSLFFFHFRMCVNRGRVEREVSYKVERDALHRLSAPVDL